MSNLNDFVIENGVLKKYTGSDTEVVIPDGVTSIGDSAFSDCESLKNIVIPDSVTSIGTGAFFGCKSLESISLPDSVTSVGSYAFNRNNSLTEVIIPSSVTSLGDLVFRDCESLKSISVDANNKEYISLNGVLFNKDKTILICYPSGKKDISFSIPESVASIDECAFARCKALKNITMPESLISIGKEAFKLCESLESVTIPDNVEKIGYGTFFNCYSLKNVVLSNSLKEIGQSAFYGCKSIKNLTIPNGVTSIGGGAFFECSSLKNIFIPDSVKSMGHDAFWDCKSLESITIPTGVTSIGEQVFGRCLSLKTVILSNNVSTIGHRAFFNCSSLKTIKFPDSIKEIGSYSFYCCDNLKEVILPDSVTSPIVLKEVSNDLKIISHYTDIADVPTECKWSYLKGFFESYNDYPDLIKESYIAYLKRQGKRLESALFEDDNMIRCYADYRLIKKDQIDALIETVKSRNNPEILAILMEYQKNEFGSGIDSYLERQEIIAKQQAKNEKMPEVGSVIEFGTSPITKKPLRWIVVKAQKKKWFLVCAEYVANMPFVKPGNYDRYYDLYWEKSYFRKWLNGEFYDTCFSDEEKKRILTTKITSNRSGYTDDRIYILKEPEFEKYLLYADGKPLDKFIDYGQPDVFRDANGYRELPGVVIKNGNVDRRGQFKFYHNKKTADFPVRPIMWIAAE